ncbi:hypothetical protein [Paenibacillus sp. UNC499MF]|uniref:hypothetical protein n=1 Tax=Paenibacillus sp. UNC499MF TaxID=1502751 RepID=UPI00089FC34C|nr:hypothetical protein [Paenibacillus sp. UNC499MF]SEG07048.1 hypothetical protein SAMN02799616_01740 [Paenibacillus sp. UNC499MF]
MEKDKCNKLPKLLVTLTAAVAISSAGWSGSFTGTVSAGAAGIFVSPNVYFTVEDVSLAKGTGKSSLHFTLVLHNEGSGTADLNAFAVSVNAPDGSKYTPKLSGTSSARVWPASTGRYLYSADVSSQASLESLKLSLNRWASDGISKGAGIGSLPLAAAAAPSSGKPVRVQLNEADASLPEDAAVTIVAKDSIRWNRDSGQELYTHLTVVNQGTTAFKWNDNVLLSVQDAKGRTYAAAVVSGGDALLEPQEPATLTVKTSGAGSQSSGTGLKLVLGAKNSGGTFTIGTVPLPERTAAAGVGDAIPYINGDGLELTYRSAVVNAKTDGTTVQTVVEFRNTSKEHVPLPDLSAVYQFGSRATVDGVIDAKPSSAFLAPDEAASYRYTASLPGGVSKDAIELLLLAKETEAGSAAGSTGSADAAGTSGMSAADAKASASTAGTSAGGGTTSAGKAAASGGSSTAAGVSPASDKTAAGYVPAAALSLAKADSGKGGDYAAAQPYTLGGKLPLPGGALEAGLGVSLVEFHKHENEEFGYQTAVAKYKFTNTSVKTLDLPQLGMELTTPDGLVYAGTRQSSAAARILPGTAAVVSYSYMIPPSDKSETLAMTVTDADKMSLGSYKVAFQAEAESGPVSFYPFEVAFNDSTVGWTYSTKTDAQYTYKLILDMTITRKEQVIVDSNFSKMEIELLDPDNRSLASQTVPFLGTGRLVSGKQTFFFNDVKSEQFSSGAHFNIYEVIETPNGPVRRLIKTIQG